MRAGLSRLLRQLSRRKVGGVVSANGTRSLCIRRRGDSLGSIPRTFRRGPDHGDSASARLVV